VRFFYALTVPREMNRAYFCWGQLKNRIRQIHLHKLPLLSLKFRNIDYNCSSFSTTANAKRILK